MADVLTAWEHLGRYEDLKITYVGDGNNMVHSWMRMASRLRIQFVCACPEGFEPDPDTVKRTQAARVGDISVSHDPMDAVHGADIVYTGAGKGGERGEGERHERGGDGGMLTQAVHV